FAHDLRHVRLDAGFSRDLTRSASRGDRGGPSRNILEYADELGSVVGPVAVTGDVEMPTTTHSLAAVEVSGKLADCAIHFVDVVEGDHLPSFTCLDQLTGDREWRGDRGHAVGQVLDDLRRKRHSKVREVT